MGKGRGKGRGKGQGRTRGAKDFKQRKRRKATQGELANNVAKRDLKRKKVQAEAEAAKQRPVGAIPSAPSGGAAGGRAATSHGDLGSENNIVGGGSDDDISDLNWDAIEAGAGCAGHSHQPQRPGEDDSTQASPSSRDARSPSSRDARSPSSRDARASDPPGFSFYTQRLDAKGDALVDAHGIPLIDCNRGTNDVECIHKQIVTTFGTWCTGVEMSDALMAERRHRYNHNVSARRRLGFPKIGHYDTWLIDSLQLLVERNHGVLLYPEWSNASDYVDTPERFGTVVLHSRELHTAIQDIQLDATPKSDPKRLSEDQQYLCKVMGTKLPLLPVVGAEECQLFSKLVLEMRDRALDMEAMSIEWCKYVNGVTVFPKLPVYLRTYHAKWQKHQRVRDAVRAAAQGAEKLKELNEQMVPSNSAHAGDPNPGACTWVAAVRFPEAFPPPPPDMETEDVAIVAGIAIGGVPVRRDGNKRARGKRGGDQSQRRARRCKLCLQNNKEDQEAEQCPGRNDRKWCVTVPQ